MASPHSDGCHGVCKKLHASFSYILPVQHDLDTSTVLSRENAIPPSATTHIIYHSIDVARVPNRGTIVRHCPAVGT